MARGRAKRRGQSGTFTRAVKQALREYNLVTMRANRERRERYKVRKAHEAVLLAQEANDVPR